MKSENFFDSPKAHSKVKKTIVTHYFNAWAQVIKPTAKKHYHNKLGYIDLFCGPGIYKDGTESTPITILKRAIDDDELSEMLVCVFNDKNSDYIQNLKETIDRLEGIDNLKHKPILTNYEVGKTISEFFWGMQIIPSLVFIDPFGYKGLTLDLINSFLKNWGCDLIFFFNYIRINMAINNPYLENPMSNLFGVEELESLQQEVADLSPRNRELTILEYISNAIKTKYGEYVIPFRFKDEFGTRTKHHLIFASKNLKGYDIMKRIMWKQSSTSIQGIGSFEYNPADERFPILVGYSGSIRDLKEELLNRFSGRSMKMIEVFEKHNVGTNFIKKNYKEALCQLEKENKIEAEPPMDKRRKNTFADRVNVKFP